MSLLTPVKELARPYFRWLYLCADPSRRAQYFLDAWRVPAHRLDSCSSNALPARRDQFDFLFLPMTDWHARIQRSQQLARALAAAGHRCFYLNPNLGYEYPAPYLADPHSRVACIEAGVVELHVRVPREHVFQSRLLSARESGRVTSALSRLAAVAGIQRAVQIVSFPVWQNAARSMRTRYGFPIVYDCHDLLSGFTRLRRPVVEAEPALLEEADLVLFSSEWLKQNLTDSCPEIAARSVLVRNGVDAGRFAQAARGVSRESPRKIVGYAGALESWFDAETVARAALAYPNWTFRLIGRIEHCRFDALQKIPNLEFLGEIPHDDLPAQMAEFDIAIIPFLRTPLTLATNPIKLYEYFSLGLPVVATSLPEVELHDGLVYTAEDTPTFIRQLSRAADESDGTLRRRRQEVARSETWANRAGQIAQAVQPWVESGAMKRLGCDDFVSAGSSRH